MRSRASFAGTRASCAASCAGCAPATPRDHGIIRLSVNARLSQADLDRVIAACADIARTRAINPWPVDLLVEKPPVERAARELQESYWPGLQGPVPAAGA